MTNREWLNNMSDERLSEWLCSQHMDCNACAKKSTCNGWQMDGFYNWLREETDND